MEEWNIHADQMRFKGKLSFGPVAGRDAQVKQSHQLVGPDVLQSIDRVGFHHHRGTRIKDIMAADVIIEVERAVKAGVEDDHRGA